MRVGWNQDENSGHVAPPGSGIFRSVHLGTVAEHLPRAGPEGGGRARRGGAGCLPARAPRARAALLGAARSLGLGPQPGFELAPGTGTFAGSHAGAGARAGSCCRCSNCRGSLVKSSPSEGGPSAVNGPNIGVRLRPGAGGAGGLVEQGGPAVDGGLLQRLSWGPGGGGGSNPLLGAGPAPRICRGPAPSLAES